jgi:hypothetical protein
MNKFKNPLIAVASVAVFVGAIIVFTPASSQGQGGMNGKDVNVVNTPNVNVVNTPTVQAQQSGAWQVGITGTPGFLVENTAQAPVLARDVDEPARQPFQRTGSIDFAAGEHISLTEFVVPTNKRLVIEYVSANIVLMDQPLTLFAVHTAAASSGGTHFFVPILLPNLTGSYMVSQQTRLYANPGSTVTIEARRLITPDLEAVSGLAGFSGYLINQ